VGRIEELSKSLPRKNLRTRQEVQCTFIPAVGGKGAIAFTPFVGVKSQGNGLVVVRKVAGRSELSNTRMRPPQSGLVQVGFWEISRAVRRRVPRKMAGNPKVVPKRLNIKVQLGSVNSS